MIVMEYKTKFSELSKYAPNLIATDRDKTRKFQDGLIKTIRDRIAPFLIGEYSDAISMALAIEENLQEKSKVE